MNNQKYFNYKFSKLKDDENFFVNSTNLNAYNLISDNNFKQNIFLFGPSKSGKTHLINIWKEKNDALIYKNNLIEIINSKKNVAIDDVLDFKSEEEIFHIINHCNSYNLKVFVTSSFRLNTYSHNLNDFYSRLKSFYYVEINQPDEEMCKIIMTKLFYEKQIIVKNNEIFNYIFNRVNRTYSEIYSVIEKLDVLSLEKKKQLTIPLIKEIL
tara:strand:+ start:621 stop:1253 length:633 start_codon:yes stop_codon:yes gene_type:complete